MKKHLIGFRYDASINLLGLGSYVVTLAATGQQQVIPYSDFQSFFVETGFVSADSVCGGAYCEEEILEEFDFVISGAKGVALCAS
ncbi:hypothetical protein [Halalkalibacter urbisdiaboli]|uniref:hypothetical protein n=1 Tax=Halalkalibacter urbisdiaboli TaxID=1960589 RepID=UPI000B44081E|nr:hypothetical protein [Halalkalibacter urbisdiaboli]